VLLIDGKPVAAWPGWHGTDGGRRGQHRGTVELKTGVHRLDYHVVQGGGGFCAEVAWQPPGADQPAVMPSAAFTPVASWQPERVEQPNGPLALAFTWEMSAHAAWGQPGAGPTLVEVRCRVIDPPAGKAVRWRFDDGGTATGAEVRHLFTAPGRRSVVAEAPGLGQVERMIAVHPAWEQPADLPDERWSAWRKDLTARDWNAAPPADLEALARFALVLDDRVLVKLTAERLLARAGGKPPLPTVATLLDLGLAVQDPDQRLYPLGRDLLRACTGRADDPAVAERARLHLGGLLLHVFGDLAGGETELTAIRPEALADGDRRLLTIYQGDARLLANDPDTARARYLAAGTVVQPDDRGYALRRRLRLEQARDWASAGDWAAVEDQIRAIEWETPLERLGPDTGLILVRAWQGRKLLAQAASRCRMLIASTADDPRRPEVLLAWTQVQLAAGESAGAARTADELSKQHPYSEAAARVRDIIAGNGERRDK
jgi:hypothetical protein